MTRIATALCLLLSIIVSIPGYSQITIGSGDAPVIGASMTGTHAGEIVFDPQTPGANRTWNITSYTYELEGVQNWVSPQGVPGADQFPSATIVLESPDESGNTYSFMRVANDGVRSIGMTATI
ncbi:hypothetical protein IT157_05170, partial [bacterium]|nr:hypothetical protein [bacterium]